MFSLLLKATETVSICLQIQTFANLAYKSFSIATESVG